MPVTQCRRHVLHQSGRVALTPANTPFPADRALLADGTLLVHRMRDLGALAAWRMPRRRSLQFTRRTTRDISPRCGRRPLTRRATESSAARWQRPSAPLIDGGDSSWPMNCSSVAYAAEERSLNGSLMLLQLQSFSRILGIPIRSLTTKNLDASFSPAKLDDCIERLLPTWLGIVFGRREAKEEVFGTAGVLKVTAARHRSNPGDYRKPQADIEAAAREASCPWPAKFCLVQNSPVARVIDLCCRSWWLSSQALPLDTTARQGMFVTKSKTPLVFCNSAGSLHELPGNLARSGPGTRDRASRLCLPGFRLSLRNLSLGHYYTVTIPKAIR